MFILTVGDKDRNEELEGETTVENVIGRIAKLKWYWAGHISKGWMASG